MVSNVEEVFQFHIVLVMNNVVKVFLSQNVEVASNVEEIFRYTGGR